MSTKKIQILDSLIPPYDETLSETSTNAVQNKAVAAVVSDLNIRIDETAESIADLSNITSSNYDETIIALSVEGTTVSYVKGDGSVHTFETQDTNTEYSLATDEITGLTKLYATVGNAEDGTMTQKAIKTELDKKVGVAIHDIQNTLIFTI